MTLFACLSLWLQYGYAEIPCLAENDGVVYLEMEARPVALELRPGVFFDAWGYCRKGEKPTVPGPTIKVKEGTKIRVHFTNKLSVPASLHPHGVKYTAANDGAHIVGNPTSTVEPGHSRTYEWDTSGTPGTWFYHTHALEMGGDEGLYRGLWGALIIEPKEDVANPPDKEFVVFMHSYGVNGTEYEAFNDKSGDIEFMNGDSSAFPGLVWKANMGEKVRFHVMNTSEEMHTFHTHGHRWIDTATGELIDNISVAPFISYVADFTAGEAVGPGNWAFHCHFHEHMMNGMFGDFVVEKEKTNARRSPDTESLPTLDTAPGSYEYPDASLKNLYEDFVGLGQGDGPWGEFYQPIPFYMHHDNSIIELISKACIRKSGKLKDGSQITITIPISS